MIGFKFFIYTFRMEDKEEGIITLQERRIEI